MRGLTANRSRHGPNQRRRCGRCGHVILAHNLRGVLQHHHHWRCAAMRGFSYL